MEASEKAVKVEQNKIREIKKKSLKVNGEDSGSRITLDEA
jgi:hypothetical protein